MMNDILLRAENVRKSFNRVEVLHGVDFDVHAGEVHGIVGQNGAGKSTLMKIINGVYSRDDGNIMINGRKSDLGSPVAANEEGIAMVFQEFSLIPTMTVSENLFLGREPLKNGMIDEHRIRQETERIFAELEVEIAPDTELKDLPVGSQQVVEIAKALTQKAKVLILDEPTASLSAVEIQSLFSLIRRLKNDGMGIIFVSHHLNEVMEICDRVTVIRDGNVALVDRVDDLKLEDIITAMIGRKVNLDSQSGRTALTRSEPLLEVNDLSLGNRLEKVSFKLFPGEILGIAGVLGSGRSEILKSIFGVARPDSLQLVFKGNKLSINHPDKAIKSGFFLVPEDRRKEGIIRGQSIHYNVLLPIWKRMMNLFFIAEDRGKKIVQDYVDDLDVVCTGLDQHIELLSGGNQQKVIFAKSLATEPAVLLLDDPTVGVDVGTKLEISGIIRRIAAQGNGVILVSSEMEELADLCDRVLVLRRGKISGELDCRTQQVSEEVLMHAIQ